MGMMNMAGRPKRAHIDCEMDGCFEDYHAKGLCKNHYARFVRTGSAEVPVKEPKPLCAGGCGRVSVIKGLCNAHYSRLMYSGGLGTPEIHPHKPEGIRGYNSSHRAIYRERGPAQEHFCVVCLGPAKHWALRKDAETVVDNHSYEKGKVYSLNPYDYDPMCVSHHFKYDREHGLRAEKGVNSPA